MEVFVPFLIAAAFFAYSVYSNFVKEQEKARKRNPAGTKPKPVEVRNPKQRNKPEQIQPESPVSQPSPSTASASRITRRPKALEVIELEDEQVAEEQEFEFDLRSAIIQDAILRRPNY